MKNTNLIKLIKGNISFDDIQTYIMTDIINSGDIAIISNLLKKWKDAGININELQINEKWVIIIYVLAYYPFEGDIATDSIFYLKLREFVNCIEEEREMNKKLLTTLKLLYDKWKKDDWNATMQVLLGVYTEYSNACNGAVFNNESEKEIWLGFTNIVLDMIKNMSPTNYQNHINKYKEYYESIDNNNLNKINEQIYNNMKQIYWDNLKTDYDEHKDNREQILVRIYDDFCELENNLLKLINKGTAEKTIHEYTEDTLIWNIINKLKSYDSKYMDIIYDNMYVKWVSENDVNNFIEFVHFLFSRLEIIISLISKRHEKK
jgi:hypothetical protein